MYHLNILIMFDYESFDCSFQRKTEQNIMLKFYRNNKRIGQIMYMYMQLQKRTYFSI